MLARMRKQWLENRPERTPEEEAELLWLREHLEFVQRNPAPSVAEAMVSRGRPEPAACCPRRQWLEWAASASE